MKELPRVTHGHQTISLISGVNRTINVDITADGVHHITIQTKVGNAPAESLCIHLSRIGYALLCAALEHNPESYPVTEERYVEH